MNVAPHAGLSTPCLTVDLAVLDRNIARMATDARRRGLALRPHAKTHKCAAVARRQLDAGAAGLTVATIGEAEAFAAAGTDDLFIAYPLWPDVAKAERLRSLAGRVGLRVGVGSADGARHLAASVRLPLRVLIEIDSGQHRTGVVPEEAVTVVAAALGAGLTVDGIFTFPGHGYGPALPGAAARDEARAMTESVAALTRAGLPVGVVSGGSTPTVAGADEAIVTEVRPGVYVFGDAQQVELGTCGFDDVALAAASTVVARSPGRVVVDAGSKVLGADRPVWTTGFGRVAGVPDARISALSEHHATVDWPGPDLPALGAMVALVPNHVCAAVNLADELVVTDQGVVVDRWPVMARGANA